MHLKDDAFDAMEITLSPSMPVPKQIMVEALVDQFAPRPKVFPSSLNSSVRLK